MITPLFPFSILCLAEGWGAPDLDDFSCDDWCSVKEFDNIKTVLGPLEHDHVDDSYNPAGGR